MIGDLFDSPWKILIVALVIIVLFGSRKLPGAALSLGQSMRILKKEVQGLHEELAAAFASMVVNQQVDSKLEHPPLLDHFPYLSPPPPPGS